MVLVPVTVALAIRNGVTLDAVFDLLTDPAGQGILLLFEVIAIATFFAVIGLRVFVFTLIEMLASWSIKLLGGTTSPSWLLSYLVRDLVAFHGSDVSLSDAGSGPKGQEMLGSDSVESNIMPIDAIRQAGAIPATLKMASGGQHSD